MKKFNIDLINENAYYHQFKNGLKVYMIPDKNSRIIKFSITTKFGGKDREFKVNNNTICVPTGIAHFLEHQKFENGEETNYFETFDKNFAELNAYTTQNSTTYHFASALNKETNIDNLLDLVLNLKITEESVNKEKGIIVEEIKMYEDDPFSILFQNLYKGVFVNSPYKINTAGSEQDVLKTTKEDLELCYKTFYNPKNMFITVTGNFKPKEVLNQIENKLHLFQESRDFEYEKYVEPNEVNMEYIEEKINIEKPKIAVAVKIDISHLLKEITKKEIANYLLFVINKLFNKQSITNQEFKQKDIISSDLGRFIEVYDNHMLLIIAADVNKKDEFIEGIKNALKDVKLTDEEFEMNKKLFISAFIRQFDKVSDLNDNIINTTITYGEPDPKKGLELKDLNQKTLNHIIQNIDLKNISISYVYNEE